MTIWGFFLFYKKKVVLMDNIVDILIIGGGIIGNAILRELSKYNLNICLVEKKWDVAEGASKANSGIVHAGFDPEEGTNKAKFNVEGNAIFEQICNELDVKYHMVGSYVLAFNQSELRILEMLLDRGIKNRVKGLEIQTKDYVLKREPNVNPNIVAALYAPYSGVVSPYELTIALYENAISNGAKVFFGYEVKEIRKEDKVFIVKDKFGRIIKSKVVVNCAGVFADNIYNMVAHSHFEITPRKGEYLILDKKKSGLVKRVIFQVPTQKGKGVLVAPTTEGNILVGPNSNYIEDKEDTKVTSSGLDEVFENAKKSVPSLDRKDVITIFAGIRATSDKHDFIIGESEIENFYNVAGIESPGLTASLAIGNYMAKLIADKLNAKQKSNFEYKRKKIIRFSELSYEEADKLIKVNPEYGNIVCRCESVSEYEIKEAIKRGAFTLDAIKRRTRAGMGRCQGGFCTSKIIKIISKELNIDSEVVTKFGGNSKIIFKKDWEEEIDGNTVL